MFERSPGFPCSFQTHAPEQSSRDLADPASLGIDADRLACVHDAIDEAIRAGDIPGAVVLVGYRGRIVLCRAYGCRALEPEPQPMTADTVFDLASLTKPIATATSVMVLAERGQVQLDAPVSRYLPDFAAGDAVTVEQLLRHRGGLIADNALADYADGPQRAWERLFALEPIHRPGERFVYSDVGYMILGRLVEEVSGDSLDTFARRNIFEPLGMADTTFRPQGSVRERCAPSTREGDGWLRGEVHDPRARALGGVAGHAGLFSTAADLARYCRMLLNEGELEGRRVLQPETVRHMTDAGDLPPGQRRGLGWDIDTPYSSPRGLHFGAASFGHTGFTGTSVWVDPDRRAYVILLTNRLHPDGSGDTIELRRRVGTIVAEALPDCECASRKQV